MSSPATGQAAIETRTSTTTYDAQGRFGTGAANALNHQETRVYDSGFGVVTSLTGPNNLTTTWSFDGFGRKTLEARADGTKTKWEYLFCSGINGGTAPCPALAKYLVQQTPLAADGATPNGPWVKAYFDDLNREIQKETQGFDGATIVTATEYDSFGRLLRKSRPYFAGGTSKWTTFAYDALGRVTQATEPDTSVTQTAYAGLTVTVTNALSQTKTTIKNNQGQIVTVRDTLNNATSYTYDPFGNLLTVTDPVGNVISNEYDLRGRKTAQVDPDLGRWEFAYDALGQVVWRQDAKSQVATMAYDKLGRLISRTEPDLAGTWVYDSAANGVGKLASASGSNGYLRTHTYDSLGRPSQVALTIDQPTPYLIQTSYDAHGRVDTVLYPTGSMVQNVYTALGYLAQVRNGLTAQMYWRADAVDAEGHITQQTYGNNVGSTQTFDPDTGRLTAIAAGAGKTVQDVSYQWDAVGNLLTRGDATQSLSESFGYDSLNRVTSAIVAGGPAKTFAYDSIGNITTKSDVGAYTYPLPGAARPHAVIEVAGSLNATYSYDANGNLVSGAGRTVTYASFNLPTQITRGAVAVSFTYGPEHQRITQVAPDSTTVYLHPAGSGAPFIEKVVMGATVQWNNYLYANGAMVGVLYERNPGGVFTRYFHKDHLGSIAVITDETGAVLERLSYDAWGKRRFPNGADDPAETITSQSDRGFTGHEHLSDVGLIHMNGRIYDPVLGRFMTADQVIDGLFSTQGLNRYGYVHNNPLAYIDPDGLFLRGVRNFFRSNPIAALAVGFATAWIMGPVGLGWIDGVFTLQGAMITGGVSGFLTNGLQGAFFGVVSGALTFGIGELGLSSLLGKATFLGEAILHGVAQGVMAEVQGGKFGPAFFAAAFSAGVGPLVPDMEVIGNTIARAVIGGTASVLGGGKFQNGAATAAFVYLFNSWAHGLELAKIGRDAEQTFVDYLKATAPELLRLDFNKAKDLYGANFLGRPDIFSWGAQTYSLKRCVWSGRSNRIRSGGILLDWSRSIGIHL